MPQEVTGSSICVPHYEHFYEDGDVDLEVGGVLFCIHAAKLCYYSEVFEDMFGLPRISGPDVASTTKNKPRIALQDDLEEFTMLLDALYRDIVFTPGNIKRGLQLALLAHKYEIPTIQATCLSYLRGGLPTSIFPRDFWNTRHYHEDPSITPKVIRISELLDIPEFAPWALYHFAIQSGPNSNLDQDAFLSEDDLLLRESRSAELTAVRQINSLAIRNWNRSITRFMKGHCSTEWWSEEDECWRRSELLDIEESGFTLPKDVEDPLRAMYEATDFCCQDLCSLCADALTRLSNRLMEHVLNQIRDI